MSISNIHSLIGGKWFIHEPYGRSLLPSVFPILDGKAIEIKSEERKPEVFVTHQGKIPVSASAFNPGKNQDPYVVVVNLKNPIYKYDQECGPHGTKTKARVMEQYRNDPNCAGIVLDIDSGGGQCSGTPEFHDYILSYPKPVVAYTDGMMCSAAYYIASAADHIVANKRADAIGSIGVMISFIDVTGIYEKKGGKLINEYATKSTEKNKAFEELLKGNPELYIKTELDPLAEEFIADVKSARSGIPEEVFSGGTWNASDALNKKMIDVIGTVQTAIDKVFELSDENNSNNSNTNSKKKKSMSTIKSYPNIQKTIGVEGEGLKIATKLVSGKKGVFIEEAQLDALEKAAADNAVAIVAEKAKVTTESGKVTALETEVNTALTTAGLESAGTPEANIKLLANKVVEFGGKPGADRKNAKSDGDKFEETDATVDPNAAHNKVYNNLP